MTSTRYPNINNATGDGAHPSDRESHGTGLRRRWIVFWRRWKPWLSPAFWLGGLCLAGVLIWLTLR